MTLLFAALALCVLPGVADAKKSKPDKIGLATYNLYLGSDLGPGTAAAAASRTDKFADEVGFVLGDVLANDFATRAKQIAKDLNKRKADLVGLQEAALWKLQSPTDGSGLNPAATRALNPVADYVQIILEELNRKAKTGKECKKQDIPKSKCYKGYELVIDQKEADLEFLGDFDNNPGPNGTTCDLSSGTCPTPPASDWTFGNDDTGVSLGEPPTPPFPGDANGDNGGTTDTDCQDGNPATGALYGNAGAWGGALVSVCMFHGIDGDLSLTMRDAIIKRKGAGVSTKNATSANFTNKLSLPLFGGAATVNFTRGWTAVDAKVRGKSFRFVNTHLESESNGSIREDQAAELIAAGGPATSPTTVLVGDLNSDPTREPTGLPDGDGGSKIAIDRLLAGGFGFVTQTGLTTGGHGELLSDQSNTLADGWIDHILTNNPGAIKRSGNAQVIDTFANGLWNSDHGGVFVKIKGKKKK